MDITATTVDPVVASRLQQAADWFLRLQETPADESMFAQWMDWCNADPQNLNAYEQIKETWQATAPSSSIPLSSFQEERVRVRRSYAHWTRPAALAATVLLMLATGVFLSIRPITPTAPAQSFSTPIAMHSDSQLSDGSYVTLGAASRLTSHFSNKQRLVKVDAGEAFFKVAKDPRRPFIVQAGAMRITAIGTAFNVRRGTQRIVVTVEEGAVQGEGQNGELWRAHAGQQIAYSISSRQTTLTTVDPALAIAWRQGVFKYVREPLADVIADLNRYSNRHIVIADATLAQQRYTGTVFGNHIEDWLGALENAFPVQVVEDERRTTIVPAGPQ